MRRAVQQPLQPLEPLPALEDMKDTVVMPAIVLDIAGI